MKIFGKLILINSCFSSMLLLAGCSGNAKESLGMKKQSPDEFMVVSQPSLIVPPDFTLQSPNSYSSEQLRQAKKLDKEDENFIRVMTTKDNNDSQTKLDIDKEREHEKQVNKSKIFPKLYSNGKKYIDPIAEKDRIENNIQNNQPINKGASKPADPRSTLQKLLDNND